MKPNSGDVFCVYNDFLEKYTACQVSKLVQEQDTEYAILLLLDWVGDQMLTLDELSDLNEKGGLKPLIKDFFYWWGKPDLSHVDPEVPANHTFIGNIKPLTEEDTNSYGDWDNGYAIYRQMEWTKIPKDQRKAFKDAVESHEKTILGGQEVCINSHSIYDSSFDFTSAKELRVLPCLSKINCEKWYPDLYEFLKSNPFLEDVSLLGHGQKTLDFRKSHLRTLRIAMDGVEEVYLNDKIEQVVLMGDTNHPFQIHAKEDGAQLMIDCSQIIPLDCGLPHLSKIHCGAVDVADIREIANAYPHLIELRLWGKPGYIRCFNELKQLKNLCGFTTVDLFGFTAEDIPKPEDMPNLTWFWMSSLPVDAAKEIKRLYKKRSEKGLNLWIQKARKPEWLTENLNNPFRSWDGQENITPLNAKKAATQYKSTRKAILHLVKDTSSDIKTEMTKIVVEYTEAFNKMDKRKYFIETVEREDIYTVLCGLLNLIPADIDVDKDELLDVFDMHRDF